MFETVLDFKSSVDTVVIREFPDPIDAPVETDPALWRPTDSCPILDVSRLRADTGWEPAFALDDTLRDILASI